MSETQSSAEAKPSLLLTNSSQDSSMPGAEVDYSIQTAPQIVPKDLPSQPQCSESETKSAKLVEVRKMWLAGFIDGEGHFYITRRAGSNYYDARLRVTNCDRYTLECIQLTCGGSISSIGKTRARSRPGLRWECSGERAKWVAEMVQKYLITKRKQAKLFIEFFDYYAGPKRNLLTLKGYRTRMRKLNRRGV